MHSFIAATDFFGAQIMLNVSEKLMTWDLSVFLSGYYDVQYKDPKKNKQNTAFM